jgi:hypothetical protein
MKNAHERFGVLEYTKRMKDTTTRIRLRLDRFIGEVEDARNGKAHLISVLGGDSDVGAIWAAVIEQNPFTVEAPGCDPLTASLGEDAQCFRGTITIAGRKPIRHLVAIAAELAKTRPGHGREQIRKAGGPSCAITTRRLCCIVLRNGSGCLSCRIGQAGSTRSSGGMGPSSRLSAWDALLCWSAARRSCF